MSRVLVPTVVGRRLVAGLAVLVAACETYETYDEPHDPGSGSGDRCGNCAASEYCPAGHYCDTNPCLLDCSCSNPACWGTCAGVCTPYTGPYCGDGMCGGTETADSCSKDCFCGNQTCDRGEDCDSCSTDCSCEACVYAIDIPAEMRATVSVLYIRDSVDGSCATGDGAEKIIRFTQGPIGGTLEARVDSADFLVALSVRTSCEDAATELGCAKQQISADRPSVRFALAAQQTAYIIVEAPAPPVNFTFAATVSLIRITP